MSSPHSIKYDIKSDTKQFILISNSFYSWILKISIIFFVDLFLDEEDDIDSATKYNYLGTTTCAI